MTLRTELEMTFKLDSNKTAHRCEYESDLRSNEHYLSSIKNKAWKKFRPVQDMNPKESVP